MELEIASCACMYAVVCSEGTKSIWPNALEKLQRKYEAKWPGKVHMVVYSGKVVECLPGLANLKPSYTCFLVHHSECTREFVQEVNWLTRELDPSDTYTDTVWGILTGLTEEDVISALRQEPLEVKRVLGNTPVDLEKFQCGVWFSEREQGASFRKLPEQEKAVKEKCPPDTTRLVVEEISRERDIEGHEGVDMVVSSGHATERDWNIGYTFKSGQFRCHRGQLYGCELSGRRIEVKHSGAPKILSAAGNCLMGHISDENCMALGWMHSGGVVQMVGYVVPTWYGYGGWGVHKYFINNPGCMSFAEAFFANQQSLIHELYSKYGSYVGTNLGDHETTYRKCFDTDVSASPQISRECSGLLYDQNNVAFYGDPAWEARLARKVEAYHYTSSLKKLFPDASDEGWALWEFEVATVRSGSWDCPVPDDKLTCVGRPPVFVFPARVREARVVEGNAVVTCRFLLLPLSGKYEAGEHHSVVFATR